MLGFFKYTDFLLENFNTFTKLVNLDFNIPLPHILLPLALSFVTFEQIAFLYDCYKRAKGQLHENLNINFIDYALFISFFPQLIAGPIIHHKEMMPQFAKIAKEKQIINYNFLAKGIFIFSIGLFKKVFIADSFAKIADAGFSVVEKGEFLNIIKSWETSLSYSFQLYFDFSGYCDMALGLGLMFGIILPLNFNSPYKSLNIAEFWCRWHITLGRFLSECVYIPLGGNKVNKILNLRNIFIVFFLSGIWHGAGWGFIIWGVLHALAMMIHRIYSWFYKKLDKTNAFVIFMKTKSYKIFCWLLTFNFVNLAWVFFRAENLQGALNLLKTMFGIVWIDMPAQAYKFYKIFIDIQENTFIFIILSFAVCLAFKNSFELMQNFHSKAFKFSIALRIFSKKIWLKGSGVFVVFIISVMLFYISIWLLIKALLDDNAYSPFIYFNF